MRKEEEEEHVLLEEDPVLKRWPEQTGRLLVVQLRVQLWQEKQMDYEHILDFMIVF